MPPDRFDSTRRAHASQGTPPRGRSAAAPTRRWVVHVSRWLLSSLLVSSTSHALAKPDPPGRAARTDGSPQPPPAALEHYEKGRKWYLVGRYRDALNELKTALEYDPNSPDLLYNVARVYENLGELDESIAYYQRYLEVLPPPPNEERDKTAKTIRRLQGAKRELAQERPWRTYQPTPPQPPSPGRADWLFWLTGTGAVVLLGTGAAAGVIALKKSDDVGAFVVGPDGSYADRKDLAARADKYALASDTLLASGGVALISAALLYFLRDSHDEVEPTAPPSEPAARIDFSLDGRGGQLILNASF